MTKTEKQTRLDQFETREAFGIWPDYELMYKARRASAALFRFDEANANGLIKWVNKDGTEAAFREGEPHMMREYVAYDERRKGYFGGNWKDCGKVRNSDKIAREVVAQLSDWFKANGAPNVRATFGGDIRYIKITDGKRDYSLID